jgi:bacillopeptidase F
MVKIADVWDTTRNSSKPGTRAANSSLPLDRPAFNALPSDATNTASVTVSGRSHAGLTVHLKLNGKEIQNAVVDNSGNFTFTNITLSEGQNTFIAFAQDTQNRKSADSSVLSITLDTKPPRIQLTSPGENATYSGGNQQIITVSGKTDEATEMYVNSGWVILKPDGSFETRIQLQPGENTITAYASDDAGNKSVDVVRKVTYNP